MQKRDKTTHIVVHHSATGRDTTTFESIRRYHIEQNGWDNIGYHCVIEGDGSIHAGMPEDMVGYHTKHKDFNFKSLGVCLTGNFQIEYPSNEQLKSLKSILDRWVAEYNIPKQNILGHRETGYLTGCPGNHLLPFIQDYRNSEGGDDGMTPEQERELEDLRRDVTNMDLNKIPDLRTEDKKINERVDKIGATLDVAVKDVEEIKSKATDTHEIARNLSKQIEGLKNELTQSRKEIMQEVDSKIEQALKGGDDFDGFDDNVIRRLCNTIGSWFS